MKKLINGLFELTVSIGIIAICCVLLLGWLMNLYTFLHLDFKTPYKAEIVRGIGIIPIVGMITGYMTIEDK